MGMWIEEAECISEPVDGGGGGMMMINDYHLLNVHDVCSWMNSSDLCTISGTEHKLGNIDSGRN